MLIRPSLLTSSVMVIVGATGAVVSTLAVSLVLVGPKLPARSVRVVVTLIVLPSPGLVKLVAIVPAKMSAAVKTKVLVVLPSVTVSVSPAFASPARVTRTLTGPTNSAMLIRPSLLASSVMVMVDTTGRSVSMA